MTGRDMPSRILFAIGTQIFGHGTVSKSFSPWAISSQTGLMKPKSRVVRLSSSGEREEFTLTLELYWANWTQYKVFFGLLVMGILERTEKETSVRPSGCKVRNASDGDPQNMPALKEKHAFPSLKLEVERQTDPILESSFLTSHS